MLVEIKVFPENTNQYDNLMIKKNYSTRLTKFVSFYSWQITELLFTDKSPLLQANCFINTVHLSHGCSREFKIRSLRTTVIHGEDLV